MISRLVRNLVLMMALAVAPGLWAAGGAEPSGSFPLALDAYQHVDADATMWEVIQQRAAEEPFNIVVTLIFALAVLHTFMTARIRHWSHVVEERHAAKLKKKLKETDNDEDGVPDEVSFWGQTLHFLGEIEAVFGIWALGLFLAITWNKGVDSAIYYIGDHVNFNEAIFVVIIMTLASTRPVLKLAERCLQLFARLGKGTPVAWWLSILILAPLMGSFITEPAAMTIAALLLGSQFYALTPAIV